MFFQEIFNTNLVQTSKQSIISATSKKRCDHEGDEISINVNLCEVSVRTLVLFLDVHTYYQAKYTLQQKFNEIIDDSSRRETNKHNANLMNNGVIHK